MGVFIWLTIWAKEKRGRRRKINERNGGNNKRNITETRTNRINVLYQSCIPCYYTNCEGCHELCHLSDCDTDVGWRANKGSIPGRSRYFSFFHRARLDSATHTAVDTTWINRPRREAHHRLCSIRVAWIRTSPPRVFKTRCLTKQGCSFEFNIFVVFLCASQICL